MFEDLSSRGTQSAASLQSLLHSNSGPSRLAVLPFIAQLNTKLRCSYHGIT